MCPSAIAECATTTIPDSPSTTATIASRRRCRRSVMLMERNIPTGCYVSGDVVAGLVDCGADRRVVEVAAGDRHGLALQVDIDGGHAGHVRQPGRDRSAAVLAAHAGNEVVLLFKCLR